MQSMLCGLGSGGLILTALSGTPLPLASASSRRPLYSPKRSINPAITSCGPSRGMSRTTAETSITVSPLSKPSLKSSKKSIFTWHSLIDLESSYASSAPFTPHRSPLTTHRSPLTAYHSPLTTHRLPLTAYHSPLLELQHRHLAERIERGDFALRRPRVFELELAGDVLFPEQHADFAHIG